MTFLGSLASGPAVWIVWGLLASVVIIGLLAVVSPGHFAKLAQGSGKWIDTDALRQRVEKPIDIDTFILRNSRAFGVIVVAAACVLGYVFCAQMILS